MHSELIKAHRANLRRYCQLLAIDLTEQERQFIHRRIAETRLQLDRLELGHIRHEPRLDHDAVALSGA